MSISVLIEKLQLEKLLDERVFVKWVDESGTTFTLGSCLHDNKQTPDFYMAAYRDTEGQIHIHFKLQVFVKLAGKKQGIDILLIVPPDADFANASTPCPISSIDDLSHDVSAIHEAGLSNAQHVFLLKFNLTMKGFVVTKKIATIRPHTTTTNMLIRSLESLSNTSIFSVYIRPSTYAKVHLEKLRMHISKTATDIRKINLKEMYIQQGVILLEWHKLVYKGKQHPIPPPYAQASTEVQASQSSLIFEEPIEETPFYQGQGGKTIEGDSLESSTAGDGDDISNEVHDHLPEYEASGSAPVYPNLDKGKKRLRQDSNPEIYQEQKSRRPTDIEDFLQSRLSALEQRFDNTLAAHEKKVVELIRQAESRIIDTLRKEIGKQSADFEESLDRRVKEEIAEQSADFEESLDRRVKEEMVELEETVMRNISEAPLQATLTFPEHLWY
ncbi:hypothetical protein BCIN_09g01670 [Botrytis cinerea B05.10]|nr:hypothetical protein BCIN_09g01670 [Botrytis cinerea B05.10]ATZ53295.1 hypothetical protein BCIN_09g01670 [Botrytis cinerea B05.10]EMR84060.1 hypothetical protein BcDW1_7376 [Botrytis cinerea BcDW1]CCD55144.1 hypothetical protein BofuT4_P159650.1 [Botrytis cinerea T4]